MRLAETAITMACRIGKKIGTVTDSSILMKRIHTRRIPTEMECLTAGRLRMD